MKPNSFIVILIFLVGSCIAWVPPTKKTHLKPLSKFSNSPKQLSPTGLKVAQPTDSSEVKEKRNLQYLPKFFLTWFPDRSFIASQLLGQAFILALAYSITYFTKGTLGLDNLSFDPESMKTALYVAAPLIAGGFVFDNLPWRVSKEIHRDTKFFTLRMFGIETSIFATTLLSLFLSCTSAFSEEILFRGLLFNSLSDAWNNPLVTLFVSSAVFGFAHFPFWGTNAVVEAIIGGALGFAYIYSDHNLAVPITIHAMYDFVTLLVTWYYAKYEVNNQIFRDIKKEILRMKEMTREEIDTIADRVFNILDLDKDGAISRDEFDAGLRLYGFGVIPFKRTPSMKIMFDRADLNKDGKIVLTEFKNVVKKDLRELGNPNV